MGNTISHRANLRYAKKLKTQAERERQESERHARMTAGLLFQAEEACRRANRIATVSKSAIEAQVTQPGEIIIHGGKKLRKKISYNRQKSDFMNTVETWEDGTQSTRFARDYPQTVVNGEVTTTHPYAKTDAHDSDKRANLNAKKRK